MNESQTEFLAAEAGKSDGQTQNKLLRDFLMARPGVPISLTVLAKVITPSGIGAAVHSRINDCRNKFGMTIRNKVKRKKHGTQSWYTYEPKSDPTQN